MKKSRWNRVQLKRLIFCCIQHLIAAGILLSVACLMLNSYIEVKSIGGSHIYKIFPVENGMDFEETEIYQDLFRASVSDIMQLVAIKSQMETEGVFDGEKTIDVTDYAKRIGVDGGCQYTVGYELDDLIKWGKRGTTYTTYVMTLSEFINHFGYVIYPENFTIDQYGQLVFDGFYRVGENTLDTGEYPYDELGQPIESSEPAYYGKSADEISVVYEKMQYSGLWQTEFEEIVFSYIMSHGLEGIEVLTDDKDRTTVKVSLLNCIYSDMDGNTDFLEKTGNWVDCLLLQKNLTNTIQKFSEYYQQYQVWNRAYQENHTNVKYVVRLSENGQMYSFTNIENVSNLEDEEITEIFSEYRRYLIYYPDNLVFMGNTILSENELYKYLRDYNYPEITHIWLAVDTSYAVPGDAFYNAYTLFSRIVPKVWWILSGLILLSLSYIGVGIYLTVTAGVAEKEDGTREHFLNHFDKIWTEFLVLYSGICVFFAYKGYLYLVKLAEMSCVTEAEMNGLRMSRMYQYLYFVAYGLFLSLVIGSIWYSVVRRVKSHNLLTDSFIYRILLAFGNVFSFIFRHTNSMVSILLPYNFYLFLNVIGLLGVYQYRNKILVAIPIFLSLVALNGMVGVVLFKNNAEKQEIIAGIKRIRDGEVDFKLDVDSLHGTNRTLADAVNNIGEGIGKAVKTSMKDEQMKTDLITNVSHDIKTPLTSIINYIDLLKRLKLKEEPAKGYVDILDSKARRLKQLTDDLVEASKISSGNIILDFERLNLYELIQQGIGELSDKLAENNLEVICEKKGPVAYIYADSRRMWRVVENLLNNICKYALEGTRVYIDIVSEDGKVSASFKNISKQQMNIQPDELTERFIRGDSARSTEGSGLGLSIAKSLVQAQKGEFVIYLDGDLFKVTISFQEYQKPKQLVLNSETENSGMNRFEVQLTSREKGSDEEDDASEEKDDSKA